MIRVLAVIILACVAAPALAEEPILGAEQKPFARQIRVSTNSFTSLVPEDTTDPSVQGTLEFIDAGWGSLLTLDSLAATTNALWAEMRALAFSTNAALTTSNLFVYFPELDTNTSLNVTNVLASGTGIAVTRSGKTFSISNSAPVYVAPAAASNLVYSGSNPNYANAFMGYPKVALSTNGMVSSADAGTAVTLSSFANAFDNNFSTVTSDGSFTVGSGAHYHAYVVDLGAVYSGVLTINLQVSSANAALYLGVAGSLTAPSMSSGFNLSVIGGNIHGITPAAASTNMIVQPFVGRFVSIASQTGGSAVYKFKDVSVWGVTNGFNGYTGVP